jgi:hypothetical protein
MPKDLCKHIGVVCVVVWLFTVVTSAKAQRVTLTTRVSETVMISVAPPLPQGDAEVNVVSSGSTVRLTLSGKGAGPRVIPVRLLVRSNTSFKIQGSFESTTAQLTQLSVMNVRGTGRLVAPGAIDNVQTPPEFDLSKPFELLSGPRISLGGTLNSHDNALAITLHIRVTPNSVGGWLAQLTFFNN